MSDSIMTTITDICGLCSIRQITKTSDHWCPDCEEAICDECKEHHKLLKATRSHEPIPISNYRSLPPFIIDIPQSCIYHNEKYLQYCIEHALPICFKCIKDHQKCTVIPLDDVFYNVKTSEQFQDLETRLVDLLQNIDRIKKDRTANVANIEETKKRHVADIKQIRIQINKHLDELEKQIIEDIEEKEHHCKENIDKILSSVTIKENIVIECQANFKSLKQYASDLQTLLGMREIEMKVNENEKNLQSLIDAKSLDRLDLSLNVDTGVHSILESLTNFGSIEIETQASNIGFSRTKDKQAQLQVVPATKTINNVKLILQKKFTTSGDSIRGCCMSMNGDCFFTDRNKGLLVISSSGALKYDISLKPSDGFDLTFIDEKTVAITSGYSLEKTGVDIINIENRDKVKFIKLSGRPVGIAHHGNSLFVYINKIGICKVDILTHAKLLVIGRQYNACSYVSVFSDKLYLSCGERDIVECCHPHSPPLWNFKDDSILRYPANITVDNDGNVYVVGKDSCNVVIISNDGNYYKEILTKDDGLCEPSAIFFDKQNMKLLVSNSNGVAFLYNVT